MVYTNTREDEVEICIMDNGMGILLEEQEKIFERFYQIENATTKKHYGIGLGLSICKNIVEAQRGKIWVEKQRERGQQFCFYPAFIQMKENKQLLLVEDDLYGAETLKFALEAKGHDVTLATNGRDALDMVNDDMPQLIILDVMMPKKDGYHFCRLIKFNAKYKHILRHYCKFKDPGC